MMDMMDFAQVGELEVEDRLRSRACAKDVQVRLLVDCVSLTCVVAHFSLPSSFFVQCSVR